MKKLFLLSIFILFANSNYATAQTVELKPDERVVKQDFIDDATKSFAETLALRDEVKTKSKAIEDLKSVIEDLKIKLAISSTESAGAKAEIIKCETRESVYLKMVRSKQNGFINIKLGGQ